MFQNDFINTRISMIYQKFINVQKHIEDFNEGGEAALRVLDLLPGFWSKM